MLTTAIGIDIVYLAANEETPDLSWSNDAKVNYPNIPEAQMHRLIGYVVWSLLVTWYSYVASLTSDSDFFFVFIRISFSRKTILRCIGLSRKFSWIRRKVYFDAIIIVSNLLLDFLKETLIVGKPFKRNIFLMASCLFYINKFLFFVLAGLQAYSLALYTEKYKKMVCMDWSPCSVLQFSKVLHHFRRKRNYSGYLLFGRAILLVS